MDDDAADDDVKDAVVNVDEVLLRPRAPLGEAGCELLTRCCFIAATPLLLLLLLLLFLANSAIGALFSASLSSPEEDVAPEETEERAPDEDVAPFLLLPVSWAS